MPLGDRTYDVLVGHGARSELAALLPSTARRAAIVTQAGIPLDVDPGVPAEVFEIGHGEEHKSLATIEALCRGFAGIGLTRNDVVIGVGGGMVTDVAGFAAAVVAPWRARRARRDHAARHGRRGDRWQDRCQHPRRRRHRRQEPDRRVLAAERAWSATSTRSATLPPRELRCGRGEMAKYHFLTGDDLLAMDEVERIARCVEIKAEVVAERRA